MSDKPTSAGHNYWQRRQRAANPLPYDQALRQGEITRVAFQTLGREEAIAFLNSENILLGGRPIALATESAAGQRHVEAELGRLRERHSLPA